MRGNRRSSSKCLVGQFTAACRCSSESHYNVGKHFARATVFCRLCYNVSLIDISPFFLKRAPAAKKMHININKQSFKFKFR